MLHKDASPLAARPVVVKYGGNAMAPGRGADPILAEVAELRRDGLQIVLVHGGGPDIDRALAQRGIVSERLDGQRVTDAATLDVTEAALCGTVNKRIVRACLALGIPAAGVSGQDAGILIAERAAAPAELGYVGSVVAVNVRLLRVLLDAGYLPVVAPLAASRDAATAYNVNADLAAAAIAGALQAAAFVAITNVPRIFADPSDPASGIDRLSLREAIAFRDGAACGGSMKPKLQAAIDAVAAGALSSYVCEAKQGAIRAAFAGNATTIAG